MPGMVNGAPSLPEDTFYDILSYFSYDPDTLLMCALVSKSWAQICRSRWTLKLSIRNFQGLQGLLESPLTSFVWVRNLVVFTYGPPSTMDYWFHETVPYLTALKRVNSLSLLYPPSFSNFDELLNLLSVFPSLQSVLLSGVHISDWTWVESPSQPRLCPSLSTIALQGTNSGIFQWLQSQKAIHAVHSFGAAIADTEDFDLMDSFLQPFSGMLQHLSIAFQGWDDYGGGPPVTFSLANYKTLQSLKLEEVRNVKVVPRVLKQITSTELRHLVLDWDNIESKSPCDWSELGEILSRDQFSNLLTVEIEFCVDGLYDKQEAEAELQRCMPKRDGQSFYQLRFNQLLEYSPSGPACSSCGSSVFSLNLF